VQDVQSRLKQQQELTTQENLSKVVSQLEQVKPDVAKDSFMKFIAEERMDDAILLMSKMSESKLSKILKTFQTPEELSRLHDIHRRIINGGSEVGKLKKAFGELNALQEKK
jgi:GTP1/Obg family GTP-binding protein